MGGDGVGGQVIGVVTSGGSSTVDAVNIAPYTSTTGGDAIARAIVRISTTGPNPRTLTRTSDSASGDGVAETVIGASVDTEDVSAGEEPRFGEEADFALSP